jgi:RsiW-degrading membrane proteinase PrsW (M82 family)
LLSFGLRLLVLLAPAAGLLALLRRSRRRLLLALATLLSGALLYVPATLVEGWIRSFAGLDEQVRTGGDLSTLVYVFLVVAPLEQGLKVAAIAPVWRSRYFEARADGIVYATAAALGFVAARDADYLRVHPEAIALLRALLAVPAHAFFAASWGYALGRDPKKRLGGATFNLTWLVATEFNGIYDYIVFSRGPAALIATLPILVAMAFVAYGAGRDVYRRREAEAEAPARPRRFLPSIAPPSIGAVRAALRRTERPVMLPWIGFGALVTTGVITSALAAAVALGHRLGIDFAAVDRGDSSTAAQIAPLVLLGGAALAAFPVAGFIVARASSARSVLEPAVSAGLAIAGTLVLLGLAAPVSVVFAIGFAPVAFGLACAGAWIGMTR